MFIQYIWYNYMSRLDLCRGWRNNQTFEAAFHPICSHSDQAKGLASGDCPFIGKFQWKIHHVWILDSLLVVFPVFAAAPPNLPCSWALSSPKRGIPTSLAQNSGITGSIPPCHFRNSAQKHRFFEEHHVLSPQEDRSKHIRKHTTNSSSY